jgi:folate-binding protein YgfZ
MTEQTSNRGYIQLTGPDSRKFLQGQVTCDMDSLTEEQSILGAQCTPKGRIVYLFKASLDADGRILLETHNSVTDIAITSLKKYAVFFKTEITQIPAPADITPITDLERLRNGKADITAETTDMFIPQMINLDALGYISFKKGCYTGQEIVARAHYRGAVKRRMHHLSLKSGSLPAPGTEIFDTDDRAIGNVASAVTVDGDHIEVLAVLSDKAVDIVDIKIDGHTYTADFLNLPYTIKPGP